ncbi:sucrase ferredoxin [Romeria aff. gracilis LEGE 07310]|uniref:Sucrase ferredoxin n=1 Tax=Vasconcelosia minhoensis LEGE 07310 TaxID=915328 RepID=A0A8J7AJY2_9CYAN|nr:sucrase ferredoxin [Romeria gracilis]MBE9080471.1 sucrase ferredoxin [Romeria aff. gracilis LEGE 07310]
MTKVLQQEQGIKARVMAIAPDYDPNPSQPRVLHYRRPTECFARFKKQEFLVPSTEIVPLAIALLNQPDDLSQFDTYQQPTSHTRDMMLCTHGSYDVVCGRFGYPLYRKLRHEYRSSPSSALRIWRCTHIGGHQFAPTLLDMPEGRYWGHLVPEILNVLVRRQASVSELRSFYRGWSGLAWAEQITEREIWIKVGWNWLNYLKSGKALAISDPGADYPDRAEIRIDFNSPDGNISGAYEARIEAHGQVTTMWNSGGEQWLEPVKQYQVTHLIKVA